MAVHMWQWFQDDRECALGDSHENGVWWHARSMVACMVYSRMHAYIARDVFCRAHWAGVLGLSQHPLLLLSVYCLTRCPIRKVMERGSWRKMLTQRVEGYEVGSG